MNRSHHRLSHMGTDAVGTFRTRLKAAPLFLKTLGGNGIEFAIVSGQLFQLGHEFRREPLTVVGGCFASARIGVEHR